ncbi:hypothetical protein HUS70_07585 [Pandoraea nosoerga]|uniref:hypothetical protein n=1 Tax=Pandoraea nosoerga TaxID=2508296 RepID=UPI00197FD0D8|nr:hypothetical protein [Pandoraea nosoerga]MBN4665403.1 hypothetical protein [Pandoraea nosoerga]MBN4674928.1 hypothetical protein [Pandoraea nosoerga]MBN4680244.1 hypothetical protein [Pandoraea nosoerga]MBN4744523.1 hypothetical protein [Pandoraea nosoerga]
MNAPTTLDNLRSPAPREANLPAVAPGFSSLQSFELMQRAAKLLSSSTLVPVAYRAWDEKKGENANALANCVVALNMSQRMGADPLMVMQNLYIVEGRPSWSSQWIIAAINGCGRFSPLRFDLKDLGPKEVEYEVTKWVDRQRVTTKHKATVQNLECIAWAVEKETGTRIDSPKVSVEMAVKEGWYGKSGSKWQTMPEVMLRYRTASFFGKLYAPELLMGLQTVEEAQDIIDLNPDGSYVVQSTTVDEMRAGAAQRTTRAEPADVVEPTQGSGAAQEPARDENQQPGLDIGDSAAQADAGDSQQDAAAEFSHVNSALLNAKNVDELDYARSLIKDVPDEKQQATLHQVASRRMRELMPADDEPAAAPSGRRTRAPLNAD